ncbi:MAG: bifunctional UDP-N-acetylglucosamine diphosphorylase/glucosamine-1-phosphate N-acetyltransferase GlmU [Pseudomonadota bacterium]|nr:bifunctional UDP-N-acetylglucosamine diphosphorylase/glucosamine-1-phosphate N-acetyltransferase GlmU [Pseudomonadota bacterium]
MNISVVILAAGQGTRMRSSLPKVLHPLAGQPMLAHAIATSEALAPENICIVCGHGADQVKAAFPDKNLQWVLQDPQIGTGDAVKQALPHLPQDNVAIIIFGDVPLVKPSTISSLVSSGVDGPAVLTVIEENPSGYGRIIRDSSGAVVAIVEDKDATEAERTINEVNTGLLACPVKMLGPWLNALQSENAQGEYYLTDIVAIAVNEGIKVAAVTANSASEVMGINDKQQLAHAERLYQARIAEHLMAEGVTLFDPARIDVRGQLHCGKDVSIDINAVFIDDVTLGDNVSIGPNCVISNSVIGSGSSIKANSVLEAAVVGASCEIGPFARLRAESDVRDHARVGNFVEIKKTVLGEGSKANHLTYLGDAEIGSNVNVGCGTITCNYDGAQKHKTVIGDNAFIGSGVELVAPVTVEEGATIGAGSTISKDAPEGKLTLERAQQKTISGWIRPTKNK